MTSRQPAKVALLGLGLIGGSIARALARHPDAPQVAAWTPSGSGPAAALREGVIGRAARTIDEATAGADLVIIAAPPLETLELVRALGNELAGSLGSETVVTDVTSTKAEVMRVAGTAGLRFVGGHPMAGRETCGYAAGSADLFAGRPWVVVAPADSPNGDTDAIRWLARACGAVPLTISAEDHDAAVAAVSHLPLVLAAALVETVVADASWPTAGPLAASGWASATRLALGDPRMGAGITATNRAAIARLLRAYQAELGAWIDELEAPGATANPEHGNPSRGTDLERRFAHARALLGASRD